MQPVCVGLLDIGQQQIQKRDKRFSVPLPPPTPGHAEDSEVTASSSYFLISAQIQTSLASAVKQMVNLLQGRQLQIAFGDVHLEEASGNIELDDKELWFGTPPFYRGFATLSLKSPARLFINNDTGVSLGYTGLPLIRFMHVSGEDGKLVH